MAHFPASLCMSRPAGSSGTQKVCETTKFRNRTGGMRWSKSRAHHPPTEATASLHSLTRCQAARVSVISIRTLRTVADARSNDQVRSQASSENESVSEVSGGVPRGRRWQKPCLLLCLISNSSQVARPPAHATAPRPAQSLQVSQEVCVCSGSSGSLASLMEGFSRSRRPPSSCSTQACGNTPHRRSLVGLVGRARQ